MKWRSLGPGMALALAIILVSIALPTALGWVSVRRAARASESVAEIREGLDRLERLHLALSDIASGARGYGLTGSELFLHDYQRGLSTASAGEQALRLMVRDDPAQRQRLDQLATEIERLRTRARSLVELRGQGSAVPVDAAIALNANDQRIDELIRAFRKTQRQLLSDRSAEMERATRRVFRNVLGGALVALLMAALTVLGVIRNVSRPLVRLLEATKHIGAGELEYHVDPGSREPIELRKLALAFNEMAQSRREAEQTLRTARDEATLANRELDAFSYSVSHDLRAPLRAIDGFARALEEDYGATLDAEARDYLARVRGGAQRMAGLIDALLGLSRVTRSEVKREELDLGALASEVYAALPKSHPVEFECALGLNTHADPKLVRVALENLLANAIKFTARSEHARVEVGQRSDHGQTCFFVRDNGAGFDMQYADKLFTAFQRLHAARDFEGTGIGLATCARVIRRHHGRIWAESEAGRGATFFFTLEPMEPKA